MFKYLLSLILVTLPVYGQSIDPTNQINWAVGPIAGPIQTKYLNGTIEAAGWPGADPCVQINNALVYAIAHHISKVDATGFTGTVACSVNPFGSITTSPVGTSVNETVEFGTTHFQTTAMWSVVNSGLALKGAGPFATQVEYTGTGSPAAAVLSISTDTGSGTIAEQGGPNGVLVEDMYFYGDTSNVTDAVSISSSRSKFSNIHAWGATNCGIHTFGAISDTIIHPVVSSTDALFIGVQTHTKPAQGICYDEDTTFETLATTSTTTIDPVMEGTSGIGIHIIFGNNLVISGGTSEINGTNGIVVNTGAGVINKQNTVIGIDLEGNGNDATTNGYDVLDNGQLNTYINILATSHCSASCYSVYLTGGGAQWVQGGQLGDGVNNNGVSGGGASGFLSPGFTTSSANTGAATALPADPAGYMVMVLNGVLVKVPYYNN